MKAVTINKLKFVCVTALLSGCATVTTPANQSIMVETVSTVGDELKGALCVMTNSAGRFSVVTPGVVLVKKSSDTLMAVCTKDGFATAKQNLESTFQAMFAGNILIGGIVGFALDHSTGAAYSYPSQLVITMIPSSTR